MRRKKERKTAQMNNELYVTLQNALSADSSLRIPAEQFLNQTIGTHSLTYSLAHSLANLLTHLLTHSLTYLLTYSVIHSLTHSLIHSLTHSLLETNHDQFLLVLCSEFANEQQNNDVRQLVGLYIKNLITANGDYSSILPITLSYSLVCLLRSISQTTKTYSLDEL